MTVPDPLAEDLATLRFCISDIEEEGLAALDRAEARFLEQEAELARLREERDAAIQERRRLPAYAEFVAMRGKAQAALQYAEKCVDEAATAEARLGEAQDGLREAQSRCARLRESEAQARYYREKYEERAEELQIELARLREGLREICALFTPRSDYFHAPPIQKARALLAEDGAA